MKKLITPALFALFTATLVSCQKERAEQTPCQPSTMKIAGDWLPISFTLVTSTPTTRNFVFLTGNRSLITSASHNSGDNVQLAYTKAPGRNGFLYYPIPVAMNTGNENVEMRFELTQNSFSVSIWNADIPSQAVDAAQFQSYRFRYIVIPKTTYQNLNINWGNYNEVAAALHLSL